MNQVLTKKEKKTAVSNGPINTLQEMWNAAISYQQAGVFDTTAMYNIYQLMNPRLTYQDIANVFSGVYADNYWNIVKMDYTILSKNMQSALALSQAVADNCSINAMKQWRGILCRKNKNDTGIIPVQGNYTESIDIVCNNNTEIPPQALIENWNSVYWQTPQVGKNYVYSRCQNVAFQGDLSISGDTTKTQPVVLMFYTDGGFNQPPTSWQQLFTAADPNQTNGKVVLKDGKPGPMPNGTRGVSEAFFFSPTSSNHVCIIAVVSDSFFSNPLNVSQGNWNSNTWITCNGAAAWHNVDPQQKSEEKLAFYNQDGSSEEFTFIANCRNVPVGSKISLKSIDPKVPFDSGLIEIHHSTQSIEQQVTLPAYYKGQLIVTMMDPKGNLLPANSAIEISMNWRLKKGHKDYAKASYRLGATEKSLNNEELSLHLGSYTFEGGKPLTSKN